MRRKLFAANWKMNLTPTEGRTLIAGIRALLDPLAARLARDRDVMVAPAFPVLAAAAQALAGSSIALGAQNMHFEEKGAFTGEVSAAMLRSFGVSYVIVGHSERRHIFGESDELVGKRAAAVAAARVAPILCVGETADERDRGDTLGVVLRQLQAGLAGIAADRAKRVVIAYEPVWAIGTGRTPKSPEIAEVHAAIRAAIAGRIAGSDTVPILYGGSVKADNAAEILAIAEVGGALVGGASLNAADFWTICRSCP